MVYELYCFFWSLLSHHHWSCLLEEVQIFPHQLLSRSFQLEQLAVWPTWSLSPWTQLKSDCRWGSPREHAPPIVRKYWTHLTPKETPSYELWQIAFVTTVRFFLSLTLISIHGGGLNAAKALYVWWGTVILLMQEYYIYIYLWTKNMESSHQDQLYHKRKQMRVICLRLPSMLGSSG